MNSIYTAVKPRIEEMLCRAHFTRFKRNTVRGYGLVIAHYAACRICGKSDQAMFGVKKIIAVLDAGMEEEFTLTDGTARVNWLKRDELFDFERVEIIQASDYDVERFCVQVGNDMDRFRRGGYQKMACIVDPRCSLSENTIKNLMRMFGTVSVENAL